MKESMPTTSSSNLSNGGEEILDSLPSGYLFKPRDDELVVHFLQRRVCNKPLPPNRIREVELYKYSPDHLTQMYYKPKRETEWYFFTPRDRKYANGSRPTRTAGDGFWKAPGSDAAVVFQGKTVGYRKTLVFYYGKAGKGKNEKTNWIMHEFVLKNPPARKRGGKDDMRLDEWVVCRVHKRYTKTKTAKDAIVAADQQYHPPPQEDVSTTLVDPYSYWNMHQHQQQQQEDQQFLEAVLDADSCINYSLFYQICEYNPLIFFM